MADLSLLDLMAPPRQPIWREGQALTWAEAKPVTEGDLEWLPHDYRDHRLGGRWFRYDQRERIWRCLDPHDQSGINLSHTRPAVDRHGRLLEQEAR